MRKIDIFVIVLMVVAWSSWVITLACYQAWKFMFVYIISGCMGFCLYGILANKSKKE